MKNKFKALLAAFVGLFAFSAVAVGVNAATLSYNVDNETKTQYETGNAMYSDTIAKIDANRKLTVASNYSTATAENDATLTFTKGLLPGGNCDSNSNSALKVTSVVDGATIGVYYTFSDSNFSKKDQNKSASLVIYSSSNTALKTFDKVTGSNKVAYYSEYSIGGAETTVYVGSSGSRLVIMGFVVKEGVASVTHTVTIKNSLDTTQTLAELVVEDGSTASFSSNIWGYNFEGLYVDEACQTQYSAAITADVVLYANYTPWAEGTISSPYNLSSGLVSKINGLCNLGSEIELTGTIYSLLAGTSYATTNNSPCISTGGGVSTTNKGIKIEVPAKGYISTLITTGGTSARNAKLIDSTGAEVTVSSGNTAWTATEATAYKQRTLGYEVEAGTYYLGGDNDMKVLSVEFVPQEVTPLVQTADVDTYTYVRFVSIVKGVEEFSAADITFKLTLTSGESNQEVTVTPYVVKKITSAGETYTAKVNEADYSFADHTAEYYVVYVVRFTTAKYTGDSIKATLTYAGNDYTSSVVTI